MINNGMDSAQLNIGDKIMEIPKQIEINPFTQLPRITISFSEKVNTGNYQSKDVFVSASMDLVDMGCLEDSAKELFTKVKKIVASEVAQITGTQPRLDPTAEVLKEVEKPVYKNAYRRK